MLFGEVFGINYIALAAVTVYFLDEMSRHKSHPPPVTLFGEVF
jgi:hypothetical protein